MKTRILSNKNIVQDIWFLKFFVVGILGTFQLNCIQQYRFRLHCNGVHICKYFSNLAFSFWFQQWKRKRYCNIFDIFIYFFTSFEKGKMILKLNYCALYREVTVNKIMCQNWFANFHVRRSFRPVELIAIKWRIYGIIKVNIMRVTL